MTIYRFTIDKYLRKGLSSILLFVYMEITFIYSIIKYNFPIINESGWGDTLLQYHKDLIISFFGVIQW